ncbi:hypothetical protein [Mesorhizobium temperatum]|uniref:hypothetical protein n=1 Tax=Mesorhizobium temperatum TaxID=241416 RepID=UPI00117DD0D3|nr:hypothetical protein [Mesorhizobium temperatum]
MGFSDLIRLKREHPAHPAQTSAAHLVHRPAQPRDDKGRFAQAAKDQARQFGLALEIEEAS